MKTITLCGFFCFAISLFVSTSAAATLRTIALSDNIAPGTGGSTSFSGFISPALNNNGWTAFFGSLAGPAVDGTNDRGIWSEGDVGGLTLVGREGNSAPGAGIDANFGSFQSYVLSDNGRVVFSGQASTGDSNNIGIWSADRGIGLSLMALQGDQAPGTGSNVNFSGTFGAPVLNEQDQTVFWAALSGSGVGSDDTLGIWRNRDANELDLVARAGDPAPGTSNGVNFGLISLIPKLNDNGQIAFSSFLNGTGVSTSNNSGIWSEGAGGGLALIARAGDAAPGTGVGVNFSSFRLAEINNKGYTAFDASLAGTGVNSTNGSGIWSEGSGNGLAIVARAGNAAPGTETGVIFSSFESVRLSDAGELAFSGDLAGAGIGLLNDQGIWRWDQNSGIALVAREGDRAPDTDSEVTFGSFSTTSPSLNNYGQIAFRAPLTGPGVGGANDRGIWAEDETGLLRLIVREGNMLEVAPGDFRTISTLGLGGFNDTGQLAFYSSFTDGTSGIFVSNFVAVPEPSALLLSVLASIGSQMCKNRGGKRQRGRRK